MATVESGRVRESLRESGLALLDQGAVSLTSFATAVMLGRTAGPSELALYSLGLTLLLVLATVQDSLVSTPYTVYGARLTAADRAAYAGRTLVFWGLLALAAAASLASGGALVLAGLGPAELGRLLIVAAAVAPALGLREFGRRVSAADLRIGAALALDGSVGVIQGIGLLWLANRGTLSATSGLALMGAANACGALVWLAVWRRRGLIRLCRDRLGPVWREHWALGRWVGASRIAGHLGSDVLLLWLLTFALGSASAGAFAACLTVAFLTNPVVLGVGFFLTPKLAARRAAGGVPAVARYALGTTLALGLLLAAFVAAVAAGGGSLIVTIYGPAYAGLGLTATTVAVAVALGALAVGATNALLVIERPALNVLASLLGLVTMLASAAVLIPSHGVTGAALSFCAGNAAQLVMRFALLARVVIVRPARRLAADLLSGEEAI